MPYSVGTVFLQVVTSYDGVDESNRKMAKGLAKSLEESIDDGVTKGAERAAKNASKILGEELGKGSDKAGDEAGKKYAGAFRTQLQRAVSAMEKEIAPIELRTASSKTLAEIAKVKTALAELSKTEITPGMDVRGLQAEAAKIKSTMEALSKDLDIDVKFDTKTAMTQWESFMKKVESFSPKVEPQIETALADRQMGVFEAKLKQRLKNASSALGDGVTLELQKLKARLDNLHLQEIGIDISATEALREADRIETRLKHLAATEVDIQVKADATGALLELAVVEKAIQRVNRTKVQVPRAQVDTKDAERKLGLFSRILQKVQLDGKDTANSFRFFNVAALALATSGAALVPILGAIAGGLVGISVAALGLGAALGILLIGFSGIGDAVGALGDAQKNAAKDAQSNAKRMRNAAEQVSDAERSLRRAREDASERAIAAEKAIVDAKEQAARSIESALDRQEDAERRMTRANQDAADAQKDLTQARIDAQQELDEIAAKQRRNRLDERQGVLDLFTATVENDAAQRDPGATNFEKEQASINLENAKLRLEDIRKEEKSLADERKKGVNDSDKVKNAQDAVTNALENQQDATRALIEANKDLARARIEGDERVAEAVADQQRTQEDNAESISDAQRNLLRAQQDYNDALKETGEIGSESARKLADAMGKLSPAGQAFALFIHGLRDDFDRLRFVIQEGFLPGLQEGLQLLIDTYGEDFIGFAGNMAKVLGEMAKQAALVFTNPAWKAFFKAIGDIAPIVTQDFGKAFLNWLTAFANLATAAAPFALLVSEALVKISEKVKDWSGSAAGQKAITDFFAWVVDIAPDVSAFFKALAGALGAVIAALAEFGDDILRVLTAVLEWIAGLDPKTIAIIAGTVLALVGAFQALSGIVALVSVVFSPMGGYVLIFLALAGAFVYLYKTNEDFANLVKDVWPVVKWLIEITFQSLLFLADLVISMIQALVTVLQWLWTAALKPVLNWLVDKLQELWEKAQPVLTDIANLFQSMGQDIKWVWDNVLWPVLDVFGRVLWQLWNLTVAPVLKAIGGMFEKLWKGIKLSYEVQLKPLWSNISHALGLDDSGKENGGGLVGAFRSAVKLISTIWDGLKNTLKAPVSFMVDTIINKGLIAGFNGLAKHLPGLTPVEPIKWPPPGFANGGIPDSTYGVRFGYMPGRDNQTIQVGGGEAILRPEVTKALGRDWVYGINARAKKKGVQGAADFLAGYKDGGIPSFYEGGIQRGNSVGEFDKTTWRGKRFNYRTIRMLQAAEQLAQQTFRFTQGSYSTSVAASGSTHAGGGAFDAGWPGGLLGKAMVFALRTVGFAAWHRDPSQGPWNHHVHGIAAGDPTASDAAKRQVADYYNGGNGLGGKDDGPNVTKDPSLLEKIKGGLGGIVGWVSDAISNPVDWLKGKISDKLGKLTEDWGDNTLTKTLKAIPEAIINGMGQMITGFLPGSSDESWTPVAGGLKEMVSTMAQNMFGWGGDQWSALNKIVTAESGWDPNAQNPSSTAFGLFQFLNGTWGSYGKKTSDPMLQAQYGLQYIKDRYGSPTGALGFREEHGWYSDGGMVPDNGTMMYDNGGYIPPGVTQVVNLTGKPEPVFTEDQFSDMRSGGKGGDGFTYAPTFNQSDLTAGDVADDLAFTWKRLDDGVLR